MRIDESFSVLVECEAVNELTGSIPDEIQFMPPGRHSIYAKRDGKSADVTLTVNAEGATRLQAQLEKLRAAGDEPFIDFDHSKSGPAAAWVEAFSWGGEDPKTGGVRAKVRWTEAGKRALSGRDYRKFSPSFFLNGAGEVDSTDVHAGALVNRPAFKTLTIVASAGDTTQGHMDPKEMQAAIDAKEAEITSLKEANATLTNRLSEQAKAQAKALVTVAQGDGRLPAANKEVAERWEALIASDPANATLLEAMPKNPALSRIIQASAGDAQPGLVTGEAALRKEVEAYKAAHGCSFSQAWEAVKAEKPALFTAPAKA
jgi:phage I-like protein